MTNGGADGRQPIDVARAEFLRVLGHPVRVRILELLRGWRAQRRPAADRARTSTRAARLSSSGCSAQGVLVARKERDERLLPGAGPAHFQLLESATADRLVVPRGGAGAPLPGDPAGPGPARRGGAPTPSRSAPPLPGAAVTGLDELRAEVLRRLRALGVAHPGADRPPHDRRRPARRAASGPVRAGDARGPAGAGRGGPRRAGDGACRTGRSRCGSRSRCSPPTRPRRTTRPPKHRLARPDPQCHGALRARHGGWRARPRRPAGQLRRPGRAAPRGGLTGRGISRLNSSGTTRRSRRS